QGLTMSELSRRLMVTNGNLTGLVERLAQEGLVARAAAEGDRRMQMVRLSAAGRRALQAMTPAHEAWIDGLFQDLSADELDQLGQLLGKLRDSIRHSPAGGDPS
ncbi:MAG: MarR family transcriptional regulator, partial [bacterium]